MRRFERLDGVRGLLAVYVMLGHALPLTDAPAPLQALFRHGGAAVDLFFALSGLVIAFSLERYGGDVRGFIAARARRLLPVYGLVLAASIAVTAQGDPLARLPWAAGARAIVTPALPAPLWPHLLAHLTLLHGLIPQAVLPYGYVTLLGPAWSLSTEWQFYLLIGLVWPRRLGRFVLALLALGIAWRFAPFAAQFSRAALPAAAPYFALGLASAAWRRGARASLPACLAGAWALGLAASPEKSLPPLIWAVLMAAQARPWGAILAHRALLYLGAISYPLYLVNEPVQRGLALILAPLAAGHAGLFSPAALFSSVFLPLSTALSLALAALLHHAVEQPALRWRGGGALSRMGRRAGKARV